MRLKSAVLMLLLLFTTFVTAYFTQLASAEVKPMEMGLYWDEECTKPVYSVDFGVMERGRSKCIAFWLRSYGSDKGRISWGSANFNPSSNAIAEHWERKVGSFTYISNWNKKMKTEELWEVHYTIQVAQDIDVGIYSWDLIVELLATPEVYGLYVPCVLAVTQ